MSIPDWACAERVLCVRLDALGDVLMTTPALRALKDSLGGRHLTLLTSAQGAAIASLVPEVDSILVYDAPWMKASTTRTDSSADRALIGTLRGCAFQAAVIFTVYSQNPLPAALLCMLADIPLRLGHCRENPYQLLTHWVAEPEPDRGVRHEVRRQLDLVAAIGCRTSDEHLSLRVPAQAHARVERLLHELDLGRDAPWVLVHPGASAPSRRYSPEKYAAAAGSLVHEHGCRVLFTGSAADVAVVEEIRAAMGTPSDSLAGRLQLAELAALVAAAPVLLANNSGPAHIAAAVGTPVVDLYALTNPQHTPWKVPCRVLNYDVPCKYCYKSVCPQGHHDCLRRVPVAAVVEATLDLLASSPARVHPRPALTEKPT